MDNIYYGIPTIIFSFLCYFFAWRGYQKGKEKEVLFFIILGGLILRLYVGTDFYLHEWDEKYHALVAKNLIDSPFKPTLYKFPVLPYDYKNWTANYIWLHKQPFPLWSMALSMKIFGVNEVALRIPSVILSTIGIYLMYFVAKNLYNKNVGYISAFLFSIHGLIIEITGGRVATDHIDLFFLFFILLSISISILFIKRKNWLLLIFLGISLGLAILSKWLTAYIVIPIFILLMLQSKKFTRQQIFLVSIIVFMVSLAVFLPWQIYIIKEFPLESAWEYSFNFKHITEALEDHDKSLFFHFDRLRISYGELIYIPVLWFLIKTVKRRNNYVRLAITFWFILPYIFFTIVKTKMQAYTLFVAPAIFIITAVFVVYLYRYRKRYKTKFIAWILLIGLIVLPVRYSIERVKPFVKRERYPDWVVEIKKISDLNTKNEKLILFNTPRPIETMFYVDCLAYPFIPDDSTMIELENSGYKIIIK